MPKVLVILFWLWCGASVCILLRRSFNKFSAPSTKSTDEESGDGELALDDPQRWNAADTEPAASPAQELDDQPAATVGTVATPKVVPAPQAAEPPAVPQAETPNSLGDVAARLDPVAQPTPVAAPGTEAEIEPAVLAAMAPDRRAQFAAEPATPAAPAGQAAGGLFDPTARSAVLQSAVLQSPASFDGRPLAELLAGIAMPGDLIPSPTHDATETSMVFQTTTTAPGEIAALLGAELERLGFEVTAQPPAGALAIRDSSAVYLEVATSTPEADDPTASTPRISKRAKNIAKAMAPTEPPVPVVEVTLTSR